MAGAGSRGKGGRAGGSGGGGGKKSGGGGAVDAALNSQAATQLGKLGGGGQALAGSFQALNPATQTRIANKALAQPNRLGTMKVLRAETIKARRSELQ
jgi:hypothetical protein